MDQRKPYKKTISENTKIYIKRPHMKSNTQKERKIQPTKQGERSLQQFNRFISSISMYGRK